MNYIRTRTERNGKNLPGLMPLAYPTNVEPVFGGSSMYNVVMHGPNWVEVLIVGELKSCLDFMDWIEEQILEGVTIIDTSNYSPNRLRRVATIGY